MSISQTQEGYWVIDGDTHVSHWVRQERRLDHDQNTLPILYRYVRPGDVVLDIGANIGDHTIAYSDWVGSRGKVFAFECGYEANACLRNNMRGRENVVVLDMALWSSEGWLNFNQDNKNFGASFVTKSDVVAHDSPIKCFPLDSFKINQIDFMKIDAEGSETEILRGAEIMIGRFKPIICMEVNGFALKRAGSSEEELLNLIKSFGYDYYIIQGQRIQPNASEDMPQYDILARKIY